MYEIDLRFIWWFSLLYNYWQDNEITILIEFVFIKKIQPYLLLFLFGLSLFSYDYFVCLSVELMLLGLISLLLAQCARWISEICVDSSLFTSHFYICSEKDYEISVNAHFDSPWTASPNPFCSWDDSYALYSCVVVGLAMSKVHS